MPKKPRSKPCADCQRCEAVLYRAQLERDGPWQFFCESCLLLRKQQHSDYRYGGTWKRDKRQ